MKKRMSILSSAGLLLLCVFVWPSQAQLSLAGTSFTVTTDLTPASAFNASFNGVNLDGWFVFQSSTPLVDSQIYIQIPVSPTRIDFLAVGTVPGGSSGLWPVDFNLAAGSVYFNGAQWAMTGFGFRLGFGGSALYAFNGFWVPPPPNDNFAQRIVLSGLPVDVSGSNIGSTSELLGPDLDFRRPSSTVWWEWTAPVTGRVDMDTFGSDFDTILAVSTGNSLPTLEQVASNDNAPSGRQSQLRMEVVAGTTYPIVVAGTTGYQRGGVQLHIVETPMPPANDDFANRAVVSGLPATASGTNVGATTEEGEPAHGGSAPLSTVWWTWTAPGSGPVLVHGTGSDWAPAISVYSGNSLAALVEEGASNGSNRDGLLRFDAVAGVAYQIAVNRPSFRAEGALEIHLEPPVVNDDFVGRIALVNASETHTGNNVLATAEPGEPDHGGLSNPYASLWWSWTAPFTGSVDIETYNSGALAAVALYTGDRLAGLTALTGPEPTYLARIDAMMGQTYPIAVDRRVSILGDIELNIYPTPTPPANDNFADRISLPGAPGVVTGDNVAATAEPGEPDHDGNPPNATVWWTWTSLVEQTVLIDTAGSTFDSLLAVYSGSSLAALTEIDASDPTSMPGRVTLDAAAGTAYQIAVGAGDDYGSREEGEIQLSIQQVR